MQVVVASIISGGTGALVGAGIGHLLSRRRDRETWLRDRRMLEWKELLTALSDSRTMMLRRVGDGKLSEAAYTLVTTIADRVFIASDVEKLKVMDRWGGIVKCMQS